jgi:hypothetical protein
MSFESNQKLNINYFSYGALPRKNFSFQTIAVVVVAVIDDFNQVTYHVSLNQFG